MRRPRLGVPAGLATALAVLGLSAPAGGPAPAVPGPSPRMVLDQTLVHGKWQLTRLSSRTLEPVGRPLVVPKGWYPSSQVWPDGRWLVLQKGSNALDAIAAVRLVDTRTLRLRPSISLGPGRVNDLAWIDATHLAVLVEHIPEPDAQSCCDIRLVEVDAAAGTAGPGTAVASDAVLMQREPYRDGFVSMLGTAGLAGIPAARVVIASASAPPTVIPVERIAAGWQQVADESQIAKVQYPGLAVDAANHSAYVVGGDGLVAQVDLRSGTVSYHQPEVASSLRERLERWLEPPAVAKGESGAVRWAQLLPDGRLAVGGYDEDDRIVGSTTVFHTTPRGVQLVDATSWRASTLTTTDDLAAVDGNLLLTTRAIIGSRPRPGVTAYGLDGERRYRVLAARTVSEVQALGPRVVVFTGRFPFLARERWILDARTGRVLAHRPASPTEQVIPIP